MREDWEECKADEFGELIRGITYNKNQASDIPKDNYLPILRANNINNNRLNFNEIKYVDSSLIGDIQKIIPNDIVIAMSSGSKHLVGKSAQSKVHYDGSFGAFCSVYRPNENVDGGYISYFFQSNDFRKNISEISKGSNINNLKREHILDFVFPLAPLPIQRAIVSKIEALFSDLDNGIANFKKAQEQLKIYRQAVLEQGLTGVFTKNFRLNNPQLENSDSIYRKIQQEIDFSYKKACIAAKENGRSKPKDQRKNKKANNVTSYLPEIPWEYFRLEDLTYLVSDGTHFRPNYLDEGVKFLSVKNVRPFLIKDDDIKYISQADHNKLIERCKPENGDILYTKVGATYGYASQVKLDYEFSIYVSLCLIKPVYKYLTTRFLEYLMNSEIVFRQARQRVSGSGVPDLHLVEIRDFKIPLPSVEEQNQIVQEIESRLSVCDKMEQSLNDSIEKAEVLRQSILKKAFDGKLLSQAEIDLCKQEADYEPASELLKKIQAEKLAKEQEKKKPILKKKGKK